MEDSHDEYGDLDAISCATGDYNTLEDREVFLDECLDREDCDPEDWDEEPDCRYDD